MFNLYQIGERDIKMKYKQKFHKYDLVQIADDLGSHMSHFSKGCPAIVLGSYNDECGYSERGHLSYSLYLEDSGSHSWYEEHQLTLIEKNRKDLYNKWKEALDNRLKTQSDLDWIFANPKEALDSGASITALADCLDINMWGNHGEGFVWMQNFYRIRLLARPFLLLGDKQEWLDFCEEVKRIK